MSLKKDITEITIIYKNNQKLNQEILALFEKWMYLVIGEDDENMKVGYKLTSNDTKRLIRERAKEATK